MNRSKGTSSLGVIMMLSTAICFSLMVLFVRLASETVPVGMVALMRYVVASVIMGTLALTGRIGVRPVNVKLLSCRAIGAAFGGVFYIFAISSVTIAEAVFLKYTYPVFAVTLAAIMFGEKTDRLILVLMFTSIAGIMVMMNPLHFVPQFGYIWGILNAMTAGFAVAVVKKLRETDGSGTIVFWTSITGLIVSIPFALGDTTPPTDTMGIIYMLVAAVLGLLAQLSLVYGLKYIPTGSGTVVMMLEVVLSAILGYVVLGHTLNGHQLVGGAMILFGGGILIGRDRKPDETTSTKPDLT